MSRKLDQLLSDYCFYTRIISDFSGAITTEQSALIGPRDARPSRTIVIVGINCDVEAPWLKRSDLTGRNKKYCSLTVRWPLTIKPGDTEHLLYCASRRDDRCSFDSVTIALSSLRTIRETVEIKRTQRGVVKTSVEPWDECVSRVTKMGQAGKWPPSTIAKPFLLSIGTVFHSVEDGIACRIGASTFQFSHPSTNQELSAIHQDINARNAASFTELGHNLPRTIQAKKKLEEQLEMRSENSEYGANAAQLAKEYDRDVDTMYHHLKNAHKKGILRFTNTVLPEESKAFRSFMAEPGRLRRPRKSTP